MKKRCKIFISIMIFTVYLMLDYIIGDYIKNLVTIYGKSDFDKLRIDKDLTFALLDNEGHIEN